ncbi:CoA transferase, partial [Cribrihabitans sp. XS_ASV171]
RHGAMRQLGNLAWLLDDAGALDKRPGPVPDEFRADLPALLAERPRAVPEGGSEGGWLDGLNVVDLTNVIAGPTIGATLARFGAKVTSVQPVSPSVDPWNAIVFGLHAHRGKDSVLLDLGSDAGRAALERLIAGADVVTMNGTDEQRDALGLAPDRLAALNPRAILVQLDAWGGPMRGPKSDHLGYDDLAQAATGVMVRFGGGPDSWNDDA